MDDSFVARWPWLARAQTQLLIIDLLALVAAALLAGLVVPGSSLLAGALAGIAGLGSGLLADAYRPRLHPRAVDDLTRLAPGVLVAAVVLLTTGPTGLGDGRAWLQAAAYAGLAATLLVGLRAGLYAATRAARARGRGRRPVVVVGSGTVARRVVELLQSRPDLGLTPVGLVDDHPEIRRLHALPVPMLGGLDALDWAMVDLDATDVIFAFPEPPTDEGIAAVDRALRHGHRVLVVPQFFEVGGRDRRRGVERVHGIDLMRLSAWGTRPQQALVHRVVDTLTAAVSLVLVAPVLVVVALALRVEVGPSVLLSRTRTGRSGRTYQQHRFRTVRTPVLPRGTTVWRLDNRTRIRPVGRLLRRTRVDELPRLLNVLGGDLSFFRTRPARPPFVGELARDLASAEAERLSVPGGRRPAGDTRERARALK